MNPGASAAHHSVHHGCNHALGQITVTTMALRMTYMASPAAALSMPVERVLDIKLGTVLGIAFALVFSSVDDRMHLHAHRSKGAAGR